MTIPTAHSGTWISSGTRNAGSPYAFVGSNSVSTAPMASRARTLDRKAAELTMPVAVLRRVGGLCSRARSNASIDAHCAQEVATRKPRNGRILLDNPSFGGSVADVVLGM
ncbi:hypothetical protein ACF044_06600 [Microbacterium sp. NPDC016588]